MSSTLKKHIPLLQALINCKQTLRKKIINSGDEKFILAIVECVYNILIGNVKLSKNQKEILRPYRNILRRISKPGDTIAKKKKCMIQKGGNFLPLILAPILSSLWSHLLEK